MGHQLEEGHVKQSLAATWVQTRGYEGFLMTQGQQHLVEAFQRVAVATEG